jgi:hypothetical protein
LRYFTNREDYRIGTEGEPAVSNPQTEEEGFYAFGYVWEYDYVERLWRYDQWSIGYNPQQGYSLTLPGGTVMPLRATNLFSAMNEAAYYIKAYNEKP